MNIKVQVYKIVTTGKNEHIKIILQKNKKIKDKKIKDKEDYAHKMHEDLQDQLEKLSSAFFNNQ